MDRKCGADLPSLGSRCDPRLSNVLRCWNTDVPDRPADAQIDDKEWGLLWDIGDWLDHPNVILEMVAFGFSSGIISGGCVLRGSADGDNAVWPNQA